MHALKLALFPLHTHSEFRMSNSKLLHKIATYEEDENFAIIIDYLITDVLTK